jgi:signal transduction histidine kinase/ActR/RegA family two-component response regulator
VSGGRFEELSRAHERTKADLARATRELRELIGIGVRLAAERDTDSLLDLLLTTAREITWSDAGSLYLVDMDAAGARCLRSALVQNDSLSVAVKEHVVQIGPQSVPGYAAQTGEVINLGDTYAPYAGLPFAIDRTLDQETGYRTKSMLVVPMKTPKGEVLGVLQLMNRRPERGRRFASPDDIAGEAVAFSARSQDLAIALAAQGAVALENSRLYAELRAALVTVEESQQRIIRSERLRALGEMAGGVAHDFNNVLAVVVGRAQLLQRQIETPEVRRQLAIIEHVARDGAQTVRRIQEFARMRRTRPWQHVDVNEVVRAIVEATRPQWIDQAQARGVTYAMRLDLATVPPVAGDPAELRETFLNLLFNALDAMPDGGAATFATRVENDRVVCVVADSGVGMSEAVRQRCFEPFFTTKAEHGTGLGLSIAYGIVTRHGGEIEVWSRPGEGSRFTVRLPVGADMPPPTPEPPAPRTDRRARILVVEDESAVREVMVDVLRGQGHEVLACVDGMSALTHVEGPAFDLALVDLSMPGLSGWEVAKGLRAAQPDVPIGLITGWGDQIDFADARARGIDYLMAKPFNVDDITRLVAAVLAGDSSGAGRTAGGA